MRPCDSVELLMKIELVNKPKSQNDHIIPSERRILYSIAYKKNTTEL